MMIYIYIYIQRERDREREREGGAREREREREKRDVHGLMVIIVENGHGDPSSNPGCDCLHFA